VRQMRGRLSDAHILDDHLQSSKGRNCPSVFYDTLRSNIDDSTRFLCRTISSVLLIVPLKKRQRGPKPPRSRPLPISVACAREFSRDPDLVPVGTTNLTEDGVSVFDASSLTVLQLGDTCAPVFHDRLAVQFRCQPNDALGEANRILAGVDDHIGFWNAVPAPPSALLWATVELHFFPQDHIELPTRNRLFNQFHKRFVNGHTILRGRHCPRVFYNTVSPNIDQSWDFFAELSAACC